MRPLQSIARCLLASCLALAGPALHAQSDDEFETVSTQVLSEQDKSAARQRILEPVPTGASRAQLEEFFSSRKVLAERQTDLTASEQFYRNWMQALPDDWQGPWEMALVQLRSGRIPEFFEFARQAERLAGNPLKRARLLAETALKHLRLRADTSKALDTMASAETALARAASQSRGSRIGQQYQLARSEARVLGVKSEIQTFSSQYDAAAQSAARAVAAARRGLELSAKLEERSGFYARNELLNALLHQARAHDARGALFDAEQSLRQAQELVAAGAVANHLLANLFTAIGNLRIQEGRFREAGHWARKGAETMRKAGALPTSPPLLSALQAQQTALAGQGLWLDAWQLIEETDRAVQASAAARQWAMNPLTRALVLLNLQRWHAAQAVLAHSWSRQKEFVGAEHPTTALTEGLLAWALAENGQHAQALAHFDSALPNLMLAQGTSAGYEEQGLRKLARRGIAEAYLRALGRGTGGGADAGSLQRGFAMAEWLAGSSVQQALSDAAQRTRFADPKLQELLRQEQDLGRELDVLYRYINQQASEAEPRQTPQINEQMRQRIARLSQQGQQLRLQLRQSFPQYEQMVRPRPPTTAQIAERLDEDEVFVQILSTAGGSYVWAIDRAHGVVGVRSALTESDVAELVARLRATLDVASRGRRAPAFDFAAASQLHEALLKPLSATLAGKAHLIVSTAGALAQVPLATLVTEPYSGKPGQAPWLIRQLAISQVPGASAWMALRQSSRGASAALPFMGWGDPQFDPDGAAPAGGTRNFRAARAVLDNPEEELGRSAFSYAQMPALPETRAEVQAIAAMLKADPGRDARFGKDASRDSVLRMSQSGELAQRRVLVFATHGLVPGELPNLSQPALAMAGVAGGDADPLAPLLTLQDVLGLKLQADWVVLSACNTAAADGRAEEALSGLARGFFYAGSRSLLVTHWAVESDSASLLTTGTFAHQMAHPQAPRAQSLRAAMLQVMALPQYAHPAFWAPYVLVGEGRR